MRKKRSVFNLVFSQIETALSRKHFITVVYALQVQEEHAVEVELKSLAVFFSYLGFVYILIAINDSLICHVH